MILVGKETGWDVGINTGLGTTESAVPVGPVVLFGVGESGLLVGRGTGLGTGKGVGRIIRLGTGKGVGLRTGAIVGRATGSVVTVGRMVVRVVYIVAVDAWREQQWVQDAFNHPHGLVSLGCHNQGLDRFVLVLGVVGELDGKGKCFLGFGRILIVVPGGPMAS